MEHQDEVMEPQDCQECAPPGIVIRDRKEKPLPPRIALFIWGGQTQPLPTLPFGRWKPSVA